LVGDLETVPPSARQEAVSAKEKDLPGRKVRRTSR
jgi:hypothetical protein